MPLIRTPDDQFEDLIDFPFEPQYIDVNGNRIHYVEVGSGSPVLCLHGEPTWSFLYRHMLPLLGEKHRAIAFDFVGFGRSDKYSLMDEYSFELHQQTLVGFVEALDLRDITLVVHDWGGLVGLPTVQQLEDRIANLVILNTFLPTGAEPKSRAFKLWRQMAEKVAPNLQVGRVMQSALPEGIDATVIAGYAAPFPELEHRAGAAAWPLMVPMEPGTPIGTIMENAQQYFKEAWKKPALIMFATDDPILGAAAPFFQQLLPHASNVEIAQGGHFLQETQGPTLAQHILEFLEQA